MARAPRLVVGLGNPGPEYENTRHNVGQWLVDALADEAGIRLEKDRANALAGWGSLRGHRWGLAKPLTYMNLSGEAVKGLVRLHRLEPADLLIAYDDIALPPGAIRLRASGSAGGHNGLQSIIDHLGTDAVPRLRIGVGNDFSRGRQADYVLSPFTDEQMPGIEEALEASAEAAKTFVTRGLETAMNRYNRRGVGS